MKGGPLKDLLGEDPRVAVVGLGATGVSALRFLRERGVECLAVDSRPHPPGLDQVRALDGVSVFTGGFPEQLLTWATHVLVSPGVPLERREIRAALEHGAALISDIDLFAAAVSAPVVAVTGSNGKSTVTALVAEMARQAGIEVRAGGNLGPAALDLIDPRCRLYVLELSSFQLERVRRLRPLAGAVLNITPDHLDRHRDLSAYAAIKGRLLRMSRWRVVNADDRRVVQLAGQGSERTLTFSLRSPAATWHLLPRDGKIWLARRGRALIVAGDVALAGEHNLANALAALALAETADIPLDAAHAALKTFRGLPHRMQLVARIDGVTWINDSKGTNVGATEAAIRGLEGPLILLAGGDGKGADFSPLRACGHKIKAAILFGKDRQRLAGVLGPVTETILVEDLTAAVLAARNLALEGDTVLLSPACASLDQFADYRARGDLFEALVKRWQSAA